MRGSSSGLRGIHPSRPGWSLAVVVGTVRGGRGVGGDSPASADRAYSSARASSKTRTVSTSSGRCRAASVCRPLARRPHTGAQPRRLGDDGECDATVAEHRADARRPQIGIGDQDGPAGDDADGVPSAPRSSARCVCHPARPRRRSAARLPMRRTRARSPRALQCARGRRRAVPQPRRADAPCRRPRSAAARARERQHGDGHFKVPGGGRAEQGRC